MEKLQIPLAVKSGSGRPVRKFGPIVLEFEQKREGYHKPDVCHRESASTRRDFTLQFVFLHLQVINS
jgi:hypothetical protein